MTRLLIPMIAIAILAIPLLLAAAVVWRLRGTLAWLSEVACDVLLFTARYAAAIAAMLACAALAFRLAWQPEAGATPFLLALAAALAGMSAALWLSRGWRRRPVAVPDARQPAVTPTIKPASTAPRPSSDTIERGPRREAAARHPASAPPPRPAPPLVTDALHTRLARTEQALTKAGRDAIGAPASDWLTFMQRRVPDLIAAAKDVYDDAPDDEKASVTARLSQNLEGIMVEAEQRLAAVLAARRDLFATRSSHAEGRIRDG